MNIVDFQLVGFTFVKIEDTSKDKFIDQIKNDLKEYQYKHLHTATLIMILKYSMIKMRMSKGDVY